MTAEAALKGLALLAVVLVGLVYYSGGLVFQFWPDSSGYLAQAMGLAGLEPYARPGDRSIGYPLLLAAALRSPWPALMLVLMQAALVAGAFAAVWWALRHRVIGRLAVTADEARLLSAAVLAALAVAALYGVVHVQIAAALTEVLFSVLVLGAVLAAQWLVSLRQDGRSVSAWVMAAAVSAAGALPLVVKPHWQIGAALVTLIALGWLLLRVLRPADGLGARLAKGLAALAVTAGLPLLVLLPDRLLGERHSPREQALFGPRTAFCTHAHLIRATLERRPSLRLQEEPGFETALQVRLAALVAQHTGGWRLLGFNGDLCTYDGELTRLLEARFPDPRAQGRFLLASVVIAAGADPLPYLGKAASQMLQGFLSAFSRYAVTGRPGLDSYHEAAARHGLAPGFLAGVKLAGEHGPLGPKARLDGTLQGRTVQAMLAIIFHAATALLAVLAVASLLLPLFLWRGWSGAEAHRRHDYLVLVALPLAAILAHHALIALVHSFDVWRYGFNMFYVNLYFMASALLFWREDWRRWRRRAA